VARDAVRLEHGRAARGRRWRGRQHLLAHARRIAERAAERLDLGVDRRQRGAAVDGGAQAVHAAGEAGGGEVGEPPYVIARFVEEETRLLDLERADDVPRIVERLAVLLARAADERQHAAHVVRVRRRAGRGGEPAGGEHGGENGEAEGDHGRDFESHFQLLDGPTRCQPPPPSAPGPSGSDALDAALAGRLPALALAAFRADAVELHAMAPDREAEEPADPLLQPLELLARELDDLPAPLADDVVVVLGLVLDRLEACLAVVEVPLGGEPDFFRSFSVR
jgi:hypothetical protein